MDSNSLPTMALLISVHLFLHSCVLSFLGLIVFPFSLMCSLLFSPTPLISLSPPPPTPPPFPSLLPLVVSPERSEKEKLETDPMYKLDHGGKDKEKLRKALPSLSELQDHQAGWKDDFILNSKLRRKFRVNALHCIQIITVYLFYLTR